MKEGQNLPYSKLGQILASKIMILRSVEESGIVDAIVRLEFLINNQGRVDNISVAEPVDLELVNAAISAIADIQFKPAAKNGNPIGMRVSVPIIFKFQ